MGVIVDIDETTSWKFLKLFNEYLTLCKRAGCGCEDTTPRRGGNVSTHAYSRAVIGPEIIAYAPVPWQLQIVPIKRPIQWPRVGLI